MSQQTYPPPVASARGDDPVLGTLDANLPCLIRSHTDDRWWLDWGQGNTNVRGDAHVHRLGDVLINLSTAEKRIVNIEVLEGPGSAQAEAKPHHPDAVEVVSRRAFIAMEPDTLGLVRGSHSRQWYINRNKHTTNRDEATPMNPTRLAAETWGGVEIEIHVLPRAEPKPGDPPRKRCQLKQVLSANLIKLLADNPTHITFRAQVLAAIKQPLPDDKVTFQEIADWIEFTIDPKKLRQSGTQMTSPSSETGVIINVECTESVSGRVGWEGTESGRRTYDLPARDILELAREHRDNRDTFLNEVHQLINTAIGDNPPNMELDFDNIEYGTHDSDEGNGREDNWDERELRRQLNELLMRHDPDLAEELRIRQ